MGAEIKPPNIKVATRLQSKPLGPKRRKNVEVIVAVTKNLAKVPEPQLLVGYCS
jgi:hypothetical protein